MGTVIRAVAARPIGESTFADLTDEPPTYAYVDGLTELTFTTDLEPAQVAIVRARVESRDDDDMALRIALAAALADGECWLDAHPADTSPAALSIRLSTALARCVLGTTTNPED